MKRTILLQHVFSPKEIVKYFLLYFWRIFPGIIYSGCTLPPPRHRKEGSVGKTGNMTKFSFPLFPLFFPILPLLHSFLNSSYFPQLPASQKIAGGGGLFCVQPVLDMRATFYFLNLIWTHLAFKIISYKPTHLMHFNICAYIKCIFPFPHNPKVAYINRYAVSQPSCQVSPKCPLILQLRHTWNTHLQWHLVTLWVSPKCHTWLFYEKSAFSTLQVCQ